MTDRILLEGLEFYGYHGARSEEKSLGQRFIVDLTLGLDLEPAGLADDLDLTIDYGEAYRVVRDVLEGTSRDTIEATAERVAAALLGRFDRLLEVTVRLKKPGAPIQNAHFTSVAVELTRRRDKTGE